MWSKKVIRLQENLGINDQVEENLGEELDQFEITFSSILKAKSFETFWVEWSYFL